MLDLREYKKEALDRLHGELNSAVQHIKRTKGDHKKKASLVNDAVSAALTQIRGELSLLQNASDRQLKQLTLEYCGCVVSLEYRHSVWPYEYMAFSRRIGELWERFCKTCWDQPARDGVHRVDPPQFSEVTHKIRDRLESKLSLLSEVDRKLISNDIEDLLVLIGEISMKEDEVFVVGNDLTVVDFKSGFGSNEKGNTLRLLAVAKAYRLYRPTTRLMLLVRQPENNHYLRSLQASNVWEVYCADEAYEKIHELTGADIQRVRREVIDFENDLSPALKADLSGQLSDLMSYLRW
ncbi:hypothetical protein [Pseudomonas oryzihabitans]|uniref:hypothetical protein n=1 Tax=Pseudomonas oryzihabitans TaxID=47885 RepID=UPI0011A0CD27|nr:hypothetical protein [Pseudomonas oryzihabitans]